MDWRDFLTGRKAREDLYDEFPPEHRTDHQPALLNSAEIVAAARVAARLLHVVARRGGSRVDPSDVEQLVSSLDEILPDGSSPQCDDEVVRILEWLETAEQIPPDERDHDTLPPELDLMLESDVESRVSVAEFALAADHDLDLEYFDDDSQTWPRFRCRPLEIRMSDDDQLDPTLRVERRGDELELPVRNIRWLMPVRRRSADDDAALREKLGEVLDFPSDRLTDRPESDRTDGSASSNSDSESADDDSETHDSRTGDDR